MKVPPDDHCHVVPEDLAAYIERRLDDGASARVCDHLLTCRSCFDAYHLALRAIGAQLAQRTTGLVNEEWVREAQSLALVSAAHPKAAVPKRRGLTTAFLNPRTRLVSAAIAMIVAVVALATLKPERPLESVDTLSAVVAPISRAMTEASSRRALVFPGVEVKMTTPGSVLRSGAVKPDDSFNSSMSTIIDSYRQESLSPRGVHWIIGGYLATGQYNSARKFIEDARPESKNDADFAVLEAVLAYGENDLDGAARHLRSAIARAPDHWVARFNLAYVLTQQDRFDESRSHLQMIVSNAADDALVDRASRLLDDIANERAPVPND